MYKKLIISIFLAIMLVACGPNLDESSNENLPNEEDTTLNEQDTQENSPTNNYSDGRKQEESNKSEETKGSDKDSSQKKKTVSSKGIENLPDLTVHYIDVGQADATLLQYDNHNILFDVGDWRGNEVVNYLMSQGITELDLVIGSHPDADHIGQLNDLLRAFHVEEVWLSGSESTSKTFQRALEAILTSDASYHEPKAGEEYEIGPMHIKVLYPETITGKSNEESVSALFTYGNIKFLFTGDADKNAEKRMVNSGALINAHILHLGHHGSSTSSDPSFINAVQPEIAIYSAGANNSYGHPHREVVSLIKNDGIKLYGTDVHGTIIVSTDGKDYSIKTKKDGTIIPKSTSKNNASSTHESKSDSSSNSETNSNHSKSDSSCVNINTASFEDVQRIKHIGPERAQDLIDLRPYDKVFDLDRIKGIGPARIKDIEEEGIACVN